MTAETVSADVLEIVGGASVRVTFEITSEPADVTDTEPADGAGTATDDDTPVRWATPATTDGTDTEPAGGTPTEFEAEQVTVGTNPTTDRFTLSILNQTGPCDEWFFVGLTRHQAKRLHRSLGDVLSYRKKYRFQMGDTSQ